MNRIALTLVGVAAIALGACTNGTSDSLSGGGSGNTDPNSTAGGTDTTFDHNNDSMSVPGADTNATDPAQSEVKIVGSPEVAAREHACGKLTVNSIGNILTSRGMTGMGTTRPAGAMSGMAIYQNGATAAALGGPNYDGRVAEAASASTSSMSKMFDIFTMSSYDVVEAKWSAPACGTTQVLGTDGKFTIDGLSCLIGKKATQAHVDIANDAISKNATDGAKIAISAILNAANTCQ